MTPNEYQQQAYAFADCPTDRESGYFSIALFGESGELADVHKKEMRNQKSYRERIVDESGDIIWYLCGICTLYDLFFQEVIDYAAARPDRFRGTLRAALRNLGKKAINLDEYLEMNPDTQSAIYYAYPVLNAIHHVWDFYNITLEEVMDYNIVKLSERSATNTIKEHK